MRNSLRANDQFNVVGTNIVEKATLICPSAMDYECIGRSNL